MKIVTLYIKTHNETGLKYFGRTLKNPYSYKGSGLYWKNHIKKYGNNVTTRVYGRYTEDDINLPKDAILFSLDNNIVESEQWANLVPESGEAYATYGMKGKIHTNETKKKMKENHKGNLGKFHSEVSKNKISSSLIGEKNPFYGKQHTEESKKRMSLSSSKGNSVHYGQKWVHHLDGMSKRIDSIDIDKYLSNGWILGRGKLKGIK